VYQKLQEWRKMVMIKVSQRMWECHNYELTKEQYKEYKKLPKEERLMYLDDKIGGDAAEIESDAFFKFEVV
jgi:hypothetical protein